jgi:ssDNA-binding Zn-finger/Zn-ribbon topoisomerase 1
VALTSRDLEKACPRCKSPWKKATAMNGGESQFWHECTNPGCNSWFNSYKPLPHQFKFHSDPAVFLANFGGYGSGKTMTSREEIMKHVFLTPNANVLVGANVTSQYEQTLRREFEADFPKAFVSAVSTQKSYVDFINGARLLYRPFDDPDKLRSYNLTMFVILEASEVTPEAFVQLRTRLRNNAAAAVRKDARGNPIMRTVSDGVYDVEVPAYSGAWRQGIIESNPANAWIKGDVLLNSAEIHTYGDVYDAYSPRPRGDPKRDENMSSYVVATSANPYLPPNFVSTASHGKPAWWASRYIHGSFTYSEARVYPSAEDAVTEDFPIPRDWKRGVAHDYGLSDPSVFLFVAISEKDNQVFAYKSVRANNKSVRELAEIFKRECADIPQGMHAFTPIIDPVSGYKRDPQLKTLADLYLDEGLVWQPGYKNLDARVFRTNTYLETGTLKLFRVGCADLVDEMVRYNFRKNDKRMSGYDDVPEDKNNHAINALEWICMALPRDPSNLMYGVYNSFGKAAGTGAPEKKRRLSYFDALTREPEPEAGFPVGREMASTAGENDAFNKDLGYGLGALEDW